MTGIKLNSGGKIINTQTVSGYAYGIEIYGGIGTVINSGSIAATATFGDGILLEDGGAVTNKSGGSISGRYGVVLQLGGSVSNAANATIGGIGNGVRIAGAVGTVTNFGTITATTYSGVFLYGGGTVINGATGTISGDDGSIVIKGGIGHVSNAGKVLGAGDIVLYSAGGTVSNTGYVRGLVLVRAGLGTVTNSGSIRGVDLTSGGTVVNRVGGSVTGYATYVGVILGQNGYSFSGGGALFNAAKATITGDSGVYSGGSAASVTNSGSIKGDFNKTRIHGGVTEILGDGVSLNAGGSVLNNSGGYISGVRYGVYVNGGAGTVTNAGIIATLATSGPIYAVKFAGAGANKLILETGSVLDGSVDGSTAKGATNALVLKGVGAAENAFLNFDTLAVKASGTWTLGGVSTIGATTVATGELRIAGALTTGLYERAASAVWVVAKDTLTLNSASTLSGTTDGFGTLAIQAGATTITKGAVFTVGQWSVMGATSSVNLYEALSYSGAFKAGSGAVINLAGAQGDNLTLLASATFSGATLLGAQTLTVAGTIWVTGLTVSGGGGFVNQGSLKQGGSMTLSGSSELYNLDSGTWDIYNNSSIALVGSNPLLFFNDGGLFEKTGGVLASHVAPAFDNAGEVLVSIGTLDFEGAVTGAGTDTLTGAATLQFDSTVASTQTVDFTGKGGVLDLGSPLGFSGALSGFDTVGSNDAVELLGKWSISGFSTTSTQSTLTLSDGTHAAALIFDGAYSQSSFAAKVSSGHTTITYA